MSLLRVLTHLMAIVTVLVIIHVTSVNSIDLTLNSVVQCKLLLNLSDFPFSVIRSGHYSLTENMLLHVGLLRVSLRPVYHLPWNKPCFEVTCHLLKQHWSQFPCYSLFPLSLFSLTHDGFVCTNTWCVWGGCCCYCCCCCCCCCLGLGGGGFVFWVFFPHTPLPSILTFVKPILYVAYFNLEAWTVKYYKQ